MTLQMNGLAAHISMQRTECSESVENIRFESIAGDARYAYRQHKKIAIHEYGG